jgi:hypothetical protein
MGEPIDVSAGAPSQTTEAQETEQNAALGACTAIDPAAATSALTDHIGAANPHSGSAASNDARFPTTDQKASFPAGASATAPLTTINDTLTSWAADRNYVEFVSVVMLGSVVYACTTTHVSDAVITIPVTGSSWETYWAPLGTFVTTDQKAAVAGTSGTAVSASNKLVDNADTRLTGISTEIIKASTGSLSVAECSGTVISNYGQGAEMTLTLPTAQAGLSFLVSVITTGNALHIKAGASDKIYLDGTALDDGDKVSLGTPAAANCASLWTWCTGDGTYDWFCNPINGYWSDGGA